MGWIASKLLFGWGLVPAPWQLAIKIGLVLAVLGAAFVGGWKVRGWKADAAELAQAKDMAEWKAAYDLVARELVDKYTKKEQSNRDAKVKRDERIPNVTDNRVCFADWNAVQLWNEANFGTGNVPKNPAGAIETPGGAGVTDAEILRNQNENGTRWSNARDQLKAIREWDEKTYGPR